MRAQPCGHHSEHSGESLHHLTSCVVFVLPRCMCADACASHNANRDPALFSFLSLLGCTAGAVAWGFQTQNINCSYQVFPHSTSVTVSHLPPPPPPPFLLTCHLPFMYQAEKLQSLTPEYNISLSSQQLADANALSSCAYLKNVGCKTPHTPHEQRCGLSLMMPAQSVVDFLSV